MNVKGKRIKDAAVNAVLISATLILVFVSAFYHTMTFDGTDYRAVEYAVLMACVAFFGQLCVMLISALNGRRLAAGFSAILFGLSAVSYFIILLSGRTAFENGGADALLLVLSFPSGAYASIGQGTVAPGILTLVLFADALAAIIIPAAVNKRK